MNLLPEGTIVRESRVLSARAKTQIAILFTVLVLLIVGARFVWQGFQASLSKEIVSYGLDGELPANSNTIGELYFSANRAENEFGIPIIFKYNFASDTINAVYAFPAYSYSRGTAESDIAIGYLDNTIDHDGYQPVEINKITKEIKALPNNASLSETDLTFSPDKLHYAYSFRSDEEDNNSLLNWNVAIFSYETGEPVFIPGAAEPEFINGGTDVVYMANDGLYIYNLSSTLTKPLTTMYQNLTIIDDYAISSDSKTLVITVPSLNIISVAKLNQTNLEQEFNEIGLIKSENKVYRFPEISPDNNFFAVVVASQENFDVSTNSYTKTSAEIRALNNHKVLQEVNFEYLKPQSIVLEEWNTL